ncbi:hypothetical protein V8F06_011321 [Rhypophila decipiens]
MSTNTAREEISLWHQLRENLVAIMETRLNDRAEQSASSPNSASESKEDAPFVECPICYKEIIVLGIPPRDTNPGNHTENMRITRCGHMFCEECWEAWLVEAPEKEPDPIPCPTCKRTFRSRCGLRSGGRGGHLDLTYRFPSSCSERHISANKRDKCVLAHVSRVPKTAPDGAEVVDECRDCRLRSCGWISDNCEVEQGDALDVN